MGSETEARLIGRAGARMLYNLADALHPDRPCDLVPAAERALRHRGVGAVRRVRLALLWLEWEPILTLRARRRFWRLPLPEREAACWRWRTHPFAFARRAWARLSAFVDDALDDTPGTAAPARAQSSEGA